jgi:hypothetical protein
MGDEVTEDASLRFEGSRGGSKRVPGGKGPLDCGENVDDEPEVFLRSWLWPVLN